MKNKFSLILVVLLLLALLPGCGTLIPHQVEFFQKKVKPLPTATAQDKEVQRQAAASAAESAQATLDAALSYHAPAAVAAPAADTVVLTRAVSTSLGPPLQPWQGEVDALAAKLNGSVARLNKRLDDYKAVAQSEAGKKIEGTGLIRIPYFVWLGIVGAGVMVLFVLGSLAWGALKVYGMTNPVVGLGTNTLSMGASTVAKAFSQVVAGGEAFKTAIEAKFGAGSDTAKQVLDLFASEHQKAQDSDVQGAVKTLTA